MKIIAAPDSFKGSVSALGVAKAIKKGIHTVFPDAKVIEVPIADGGEGTVEAMVTASNGTLYTHTVSDPLGNRISASWGVLGDKKTAVIEMAAASGITLVPSDKRDPRKTSTYGTGELIKAALDQGFRHIVIGIGGSATNDGGTGMLKALGARFLDREGNMLDEGGAFLAQLNNIDLSGLDSRLQETLFTVACDVDNPLCGQNGASAIYGPQKGASPEMVAELDAALGNFAIIADRVTGKKMADYPGAGAAGGLGAGLLYFLNASLRPGIEVILDSIDFASLAADADLVITGEGRTDYQTIYGKAPVGVAKTAKLHNVPVICLSGGLGNGAEAVLDHGIDAIQSIVPEVMPLEKCMQHGEEYIEKAAAGIAQLLKIGKKLK